ncbi:MAG: ATP-binding protein [Actinomycetota bacterium]
MAREDRTAPASRPEVGHRFLGRDSELKQLVGVVEEALVGRGRFVMIGGEAGIGKTRLAEELASQVARANFDVVWGSCWTGEGTPPFWPWIQVARSLSRIRPDGIKDEDYRGIAQIVPELGGSEHSHLPSNPSARFRLLDGAATSLLSLAQDRPLFIVLDDLHRSDDATLALTRLLAGQIPRAPLLLIATFRDTPADTSDALEELVEELSADTVFVSLRGVDRDATRGVIEDAVGVDPSTAMLDLIHRQTEGNPFFVREVSKLLSTQGRLQALRTEESIPIPQGIRQVLQRRFARLSQPCSEFLAAAAIHGISFDGEFVARLVPASSGIDVAAIDEAQEARVIRPGDKPGQYRFIHALMREALLAELSAPTKARLHEELAEALETQGGDPFEIAHHYLEASPRTPGYKVVASSRLAGERALRMHAYAEAAAHFGDALHALPGDAASSERAALLVELAEASSRTADRPKAADLYKQAIALARSAKDPEVLARAILGLVGGPGGFEVPTHDLEIVPLLEEALEALPQGSSSVRSWIQGRLSVALSFRGQDERRALLAREAAAGAEEASDPGAHAYALSAYCDVIAGPDHVEERANIASTMVRLAREADDPELELLARRFRVVALAERGDFLELDREVLAFERVVKSLNQPISAWYVPLWRAMRAHMRGRYDETFRLLAEAESIGVDQAGSENAYMLVFSLKWPLLHELGRVGELDAEVDEICAQYPDIHSTQIVGSLQDLWTGRKAQGGGYLDRAVVGGLSEIPKDTIWLGSLALIASLCRGVKDDRLALQLYSALLPYKELFAFDGIAAVCFGSVHHWLGTMAAMLGRTEAAVEHFEAALTAHRRAGAVVWVAHTERAYGDLLAGLEDVDRQKRSVAMRNSAEETYAQLGVRYSMIDPGGTAAPAVEHASQAARFSLKGDYWDVAYGGHSAIVKDTRGMRDLARLLANPGTEFHVLDLLGAPRSSATPDPVLDDRAREGFKQRAAEIREEIEAAHAIGDDDRAARLKEELEALTSELASAYGLGGRSRTMADPAERARKTVTWRLRDAVGRIDKEHAQLGRHLANSIRTGIFCSYEPEEPMRWATTSNAGDFPAPSG